MRSRKSDLGIEPRAATLEALAALLRAGHSARVALKVWHLHAPAEIAGRVRTAAQTIDLGGDTGESIDRVSHLFDDERTEVLRAFQIGGGSGENLAAALERSAGRLRATAARHEAARSSAAAARLSARLVASLPFAVVPFLPLADAFRFDVAGIALLAMGALLTAGGIRWIDRLSPALPEADELSGFAERMASLLHAGLPVPNAAARAAGDRPGSALRRVTRLTRLGLTWGQALGRCHDADFRSVGRLLTRSEQLGVPIADALESLADERRSAAARRFEDALRRAPVRMVVPLAICILPGFGLLALSPFLRSLTLSL